MVPSQSKQTLLLAWRIVKATKHYFFLFVLRFFKNNFIPTRPPGVKLFLTCPDPSSAPQPAHTLVLGHLP